MTSSGEPQVNQTTLAPAEQFIAEINDLLAGSYDNSGIRRWWHRPRTALDGRTPHDIVDSPDFAPDSTAVATVRTLATKLAGPGTAT